MTAEPPIATALSQAIVTEVSDFETHLGTGAPGGDGMMAPLSASDANEFPWQLWATMRA